MLTKGWPPEDLGSILESSTHEHHSLQVQSGGRKEGAVTVPRTWLRVVLASAERLPLLRELQTGTRKGALLGAAIGLFLLLPVGALLGHLNRGAGGALIGTISGSLGGLVLGGIVGGILGARHLPQEGDVLLSIELDERKPSFAPGQSLTGHVRVTVENTLRINDAKAYLLCRGFYVHDEIDERNAGQPRFVHRSCEYLLKQADLIPVTTIRRGVSHRYPFRFTIPLNAVPSHHGYVCSVRWTVHALLDAPDISPVHAQQEFLVESAPPVPPKALGERQSIAVSQVCQLILGLPRAVYCEGETVSGHVHITPSRRFDAQEVRAVVLRIENVQASDDHFVYVVDGDPASGTLRGQRRQGGQGTTYVWLEGEDMLSGPLTFRPGQRVTRLFSIPVPSNWRPTLSTEHGSVIWKVGIVVSLAGARDVRAFHEVIVHTGSARVTGRFASHSAGRVDKQAP